MRFGLVLAAAVLGRFVASAVGADLLPPGHRPIPLGTHALVGGRVIPKPGSVIEGATILIRDGLIAAIGADVPPPPDARIWNMAGMTIYAGFIDSCLTLAVSNRPLPSPRLEPIRLASGSFDFYGVNRAPAGSAVAGPRNSLPSITPERRVVDAYAPDAKTTEALRELGFTVGNFVPDKGILRGSTAVFSLSDSSPNDAVLKPDAFQYLAFETGKWEGVFPDSLMGVIAAVRQTFFDAQHNARERSNFVQHPSGRKRPPYNPSLESLGPALERRMPVLIEAGSALMTDRAARVARELGLEFALIASGEEWRRPELAKTAGVAWIVPVDFPEVPRWPDPEDWRQVSLDQLRAWDWAPENPALLRRQGIEIALTTFGLADRKDFRRKLRAARDRGLTETDCIAALTTIPAKMLGLGDRLGTIEAGKIANLTVVAGRSYFDDPVRAVWIDGASYPVVAVDDLSAGSTNKAKLEAQITLPRLARPPALGRGPLTNPPVLWITNATIWTCGPQGILTNGSMEVEAGKIRVVRAGSPLDGDVPRDSMIVDAGGGHLVPGIIDAHNHSMILGAVNEATLPSTAMVRVEDVVNSESANIRYQLAGGVTCVNLLHGSANPIGGQNCVIKLRDGASPAELKFAEAPPGIKFALGENVKQSNWGDKFNTRFPQTRMGIRTFLANRFTAARIYLDELAAARKGGVIPRRDLELEALGEVIEGRRWIHCHSYRQDEMIMFLRLMEEWGVRVGTLQHALEGYKIADEIARHGAGASCFADWWAYKFEVIDAIPYAGALMHERGVLVSFNSDSSDHARRLNFEAAKAIKYGGMPPENALQLVTLNPARQLRVDRFVGSLEAGKDADFALWSGSPLETQSICEQTWVDGKKYFDRDDEVLRVTALQTERAELLARAREAAQKAADVPGASPEGKGFFRRTWEHLHDGVDRQCLEEVR